MVQTTKDVQTLYTPTDIAIDLGVTNAAVSSWARERDDTPPPAFRIKTGAGHRYLWDDTGLRRWRGWLADRKKNDPYWRDNR